MKNAWTLSKCSSANSTFHRNRGGVALFEYMKSLGGATASESSEKQSGVRYKRSAVGFVSALGETKGVRNVAGTAL